MSLSDIVILNTRVVDYFWLIRVTSKSDTINLMQNIDVTKKV